jgi:hypothetical protein
MVCASMHPSGPTAFSRCLLRVSPNGCAFKREAVGSNQGHVLHNGISEQGLNYFYYDCHPAVWVLVSQTSNSTWQMVLTWFEFVVLCLARQFYVFCPPFSPHLQPQSNIGCSSPLFLVAALQHMLPLHSGRFELVCSLHVLTSPHLRKVDNHNLGAWHILGDAGTMSQFTSRSVEPHLQSFALHVFSNVCQVQCLGF